MNRTAFCQFVLLFGFLIYTDWFVLSRTKTCVNREDVFKFPRAPPVAIHIAEFPDNNVKPVGYNLTFVCTGNRSREGDTLVQNAEQPFLIHLFFRRRKVKKCGGRYSDREDTKTCKIHIKEASRNNSGEYGCTVSNLMKCSIAVLTLNLEEPSKPRFVIHPNAQDNVLIGKKANFSCEALGIPRPVITWLKDGRRIPKDSIKVENKTFSLLTIESVELKDQGEYWCEANSSEGWSRSAVANLTVIWKPVFSIHPMDVFVEEGSDAIFKCAATGSPRPKISWLKNNSLIPSPTLIQNGSTSYLVVHAVKKEQNYGMYKCVAVNLAGKTSSKAGKLTCTKAKAAEISTVDTRQRAVTDNIKGSSRSLTIVWASVGSVVFAIILVALVYMLRRFWCRTNINKPDVKIAEGQDEFLLLEITRNTLADLRDDHNGLRFQEVNQSTRDTNEVADDETYLKEMGINRDWQIPREKLEITRETLGRGEFAMVNKGFYLRRDGNKLPVAVKTLKDNNNLTDRLALISEIETLTKVGRHPNIVSLVGACTFEEPLCVVVEFVPGGSLDKILRKSQVHRCMGEEHPPYANIWSRLTERELLQIASDIANGMKHLESNLASDTRIY
ncbi:myoblast growth factor receptor egl-15-like isoform X2 [Oculina patagonica]